MKKIFGVILVIGFVCAAYFFSRGTAKTDMASSNEPVGDLREPATAVAVGNQQAIVDQMNGIILNLKNRGEVKKAALEIVKLASSAEAKAYPAVQMYAAVASLVPKFEGVIYRCRAFVEVSDWLHMASLFGFRDFKYNDYLYGTHVNAIFDYLSYPSQAAGKPFQTVAQLQDFLLFEIAPQIEDALKGFTELEKLPSENFEFDFDRTILVGRNNGLRFIDPEETKKQFIKPYFYTVRFLLERALGTVYYIGAMDLNELPVIYNRVIQKTTINTFKGNLRLGNVAKGVTPEMTYNTVKESKSFLKWRENIVQTSTGKPVTVQSLLDRAFFMGQSSAQNQLFAYVCGLKYPYFKSRNQIMEINNKSAECSSLNGIGEPKSYFVTEGSKYLMDPNSMILNFKKKYNMFKDRVRAYGTQSAQGEYVTITSDVTGKPVRINVKALFSEKNSQRDFLPTGYSNSPASSAAAGLPGVHAWNYDHGKPMTFNDYTFGGFFDKSQVSDTNSLYQTMATVLYTDAIAPFAIFIRVPSTARYFIPPTEIINQ